MNGFNGKILKIDLNTGIAQVEEKCEDWYRIYPGGGLLGTYYLLNETPAKIDAYDPKNLLIFTSSVVAGNDAPSLARFSVVTKSPLSQGVAETRCEGEFGQYLKGSGYDAIIISGRAEKPIYIIINQKEVRIHDAEELWGSDTSEATKILEKKHGREGLHVAAIGQAGENLVRYASIVTDRSVQAMRMGVGAVMGSKNLKALVLKGKNMPEVHNIEGIEKIKEYFSENMEKNQLSMWQKDAPGFSAWVDLSDDETAYLGVNNFESNLLAGRENYKREKFQKYYRGDKTCPGCPNDCIKYICTDENEVEASGIHQEVTGSMGPNIGNTNLELMLNANILCNKYGIDPVSLGFTISFIMEAYENGDIGRDQVDNMDLRFGNQEDIIPLIHKIVFRKGIGDILAEGSKKASEILGENTKKYALHVKGIEMVSFDPRTQTNLGLGYATAPIGPRYDICEHDWDFDITAGWGHTLNSSRTLGILERIPMDCLSKLKVRNYKALNNIWSACDALDMCVFACAPTRVLTLEKMAELVEAITGWRTSSYEIMRWGERRNHLMRIYNLREGFDKFDDVLPEKFYNQAVTDGRLKGSVIDKDKFSIVVETYYEMMGWDREGIPLDATLYDHHLDWTIPLVAAFRTGRI